MAQANLRTISIIGCGWLGKPLAVRLLAEGYLVKGSTTTPAKLPELQDLGIEAYVAGLHPEPQGEHWPALLAADVLIVDIPPRLSQQGGDFHPQQMEFLLEMLKKTPISEIIYVSSTSVYPELNRVVTEADAREPGQSAAPALVRAEQSLLETAHAGRKVTVLRCGGLMGYDRNPGKYVRGKQNLTTAAVPVNYLHRDDAVGLINALLNAENPGGVYNAVAPLHPTRRSVYENSCRTFGWEVPTFREPDLPESFKIVSSDKISAFLSYSFHYPDPLDFYYEPA